MEKNFKSCDDATVHGHCIVKEEVILPDSDDEIDVEKVDKEIYSNLRNTSFSDSQAEIELDKQNESNRTLARRKSGCLRNKNSSVNNKQRTALAVFAKSENVEGCEGESENSTDTINNKKPEVVLTTEQDIDDLVKKVAKAYCKKCRKKSEVIRQKSRCDKCDTPFSYICHTCDKKYVAYTNLRYHLKVKHIEVDLTYPCSICGRTFGLRKALMAHCRDQHNIHESLQCSKCCIKFSRPVNKVIHEKFCGKEIIPKCEKTNFYKCDKCFYKTRYKKRLKSHKLEKHTEGFKAECQNCPKIFKTLRSLRRHVIYYCNKTKEFECHYCGHKVYRKDQLIRHIDQSHMKGYYSNSNIKKNFKRTRICEICGVTLDPDERMKLHRIKCNSSLPPVNRVYKYKKESRICKYCDETLKPYEHMRYHVERCESAPLTLRHTAERSKLPNIETAIKKLAMSYCIKCKVERRYENRTPRCIKCDKLLRFACTSCSKNFVNKDHLRTHLRRNHVRTLKFYRCDKCYFSYKRKWNLMIHQRDVHSIKYALCKVST